MRVLWICYNPIGKSSEILSGIKSQSGTWVDATLQEIVHQKDIVLAIASIIDKNIKKYDEKTGVTFYGIKEKRCIGGRPVRCLNSWEKLIEDFNPDIIQVWGTEYKNGLDIARTARKRKIPILFYMQGVVQAIAAHPHGDISTKEYYQHLGLLGRFRLYRDFYLQKRFEKQAEWEKEMVALSNGILIDNAWCAAYFPETKAYMHSLPINEVFMKRQHRDEDAEPYSIMCCAGRGAHKGLHVLIKALSRVKQVYPNIKVYIPGNMNSRNPKFLFEPAYITYINRLIKQLDLQENIVFCGQLSSGEMAEKMNKSQIFVLPSCVENHSSTLREAMYLGLPCITTMVGSVHEFVEHKKNGMIFRYPECEQLSQYIIHLFLEESDRIELGKNAYVAIREEYLSKNKDLVSIYKEILDNV